MKACKQSKVVADTGILTGGNMIFVPLLFGARVFGGWGVGVAFGLKNYFGILQKGTGTLAFFTELSHLFNLIHFIKILIKYL